MKKVVIFIFFTVKILNVNFYKLIANVLFMVNLRKFTLR
jgi:hypothetical protein